MHASVPVAVWKYAARILRAKGYYLGGSGLGISGFSDEFCAILVLLGGGGKGK